jgi:SagB-type dehydrogenase family enzyme
VKDVLSLESLSPEDNLLEQGASSVDMIRIANRVEQLNGGVRPRLDDIYDEPTSEGIAKLITSDDSGNAQAETNSTDSPKDTSGNHLGGMLSVPGANKNPILSKELRSREEVKEFKAANHGRRNDLDAIQGVMLNDMLPVVDGTRPRRRKTRRLYSQRLVTMDEISTLVGSLRADGSAERRFNFGSSGPTYSIASYVVIKADRVEGVPAGSYWYDPDGNRLVPVGGIGEFGPDAVWGDINKNMLRSAAFGIALVYRPAAIWPVYDRASDRYAILEAGFMSQLIEMQAEEMGMGVCQVGAMDSEQFTKAADLPEGDVVVNWIVGGVRLESGDDSGFGSTVVEEII